MKLNEILLVSPTKFELNNFISQFNKEQISNKIVQFKFNNLLIDYAETGIGKINTSIQLIKLLRNNNYKMVVMAGIAGCFDRSLPLGECYIVEHEYDIDIGAEDGEDFLEMEMLGLPNLDDTIIHGIESYFPQKSSLKKLRAITSDTVHGNEQNIEKLLNRYHKKFNCFPHLESMEGYAFFKTCKVMNIPFIQIRSTSNYVERRNKSNWKLSEAIEKLNEGLFVLFEEINL